MKYFRYHNTNCFFIDSTGSCGLLAFDAGWPCTFYEYQRELKKVGCIFEQVKWAIVSHFHMDHAGLISEFLNNNVSCFVTEEQFNEIDNMERLIQNNMSYKDYPRIDKKRLEVLNVNEMSIFLNKKGIHGEIVQTQGHSIDSISLITESREAFIGDLDPVEQIMPNDIVKKESWNLLLSKGIRKAYPSHASIIEIGNFG